MRKLRRALIMSASIPCAILPINPALAAQIKVEPISDSDLVIIVVSGEILKGDEARFRRISLEHERAAVLLDSPGGALGPALSIGRAIRLREYTTIVSKDGLCASACALIWLAGSPRLLSPAGKVGFHASYFEEDGKLIETGVGNAIVGHYLSQLNLSERAVIFATQASPEKITWLNEQSRGASGIDFEPFKDVDEPAAQPATSPGQSASLDLLFSMANPYECEMSEKMLAIFKGLVKMDQTTWEASQGAAVMLPGAERPVTPTFSRNRESGDGYDAREVLATLPISATWMGLQVREIQYSFFEQSSNYEYRIVFQEPYSKALVALNRHGFRLKGVGIANEFHPGTAASYGVVLTASDRGSTLTCGSRMFY